MTNDIRLIGSFHTKISHHRKLLCGSSSSARPDSTGAVFTRRIRDPGDELAAGRAAGRAAELAAGRAAGRASLATATAVFLFLFVGPGSNSGSGPEVGVGDVAPSFSLPSLTPGDTGQPRPTSRG